MTTVPTPASRNDDSRRNRTFVVVIVVLLATVVIAPAFIYLILDRDGTISATIRSERDDPVSFRAYLDDVLVEEGTFAARGQGVYAWRVDWWLSSCTAATIRVDFSDGAGPSTRTLSAWVCDGGEVAVTIVL